jgi:hypothetical protein
MRYTVTFAYARPTCRLSRRNQDEVRPPSKVSQQNADTFGTTGHRESDTSKPRYLRTRADLNYMYTCAHILTLRTHFAKRAQNERCCPNIM